MKNFYFLFAVLVSSVSVAQVINFPDPNLKAALLNISGPAAVDSNGDGEITVSEEQDFAWPLDLSDSNISNTTGLEHFNTCMGPLDLSNNQITSIDLSPFESCSQFILNGNQISASRSIPVRFLSIRLSMSFCWTIHWFRSPSTTTTPTRNSISTGSQCLNRRRISS